MPKESHRPEEIVAKLRQVELLMPRVVKAAAISASVVAPALLAATR